MGYINISAIFSAQFTACAGIVATKANASEPTIEGFPLQNTTRDKCGAPWPQSRGVVQH
jgi:hypothetical protein